MSLRDKVEKDGRNERAFYEKQARAMLKNWLGTEPRLLSGLRINEGRLSSKVEVSGEAEFEVTRGEWARVEFEATFKIGDGYVYTDASRPVTVTLLPEKKRAKNRLHLLDMCSSRRK